MNYIRLRGELINLENHSYIRRVRSGEWEVIEFRTVNIESNQIRFFSGDDDYLCIDYGRNSAQWKADWNRILDWTCNQVDLTKRSPDPVDES